MSTAAMRRLAARPAAAIYDRPPPRGRDFLGDPPTEDVMRCSPMLVACVIAATLLPRPALAFCGFYVASGEAKLFNHASQVVLVRDGDRTVITMASDFKGEPREFAIVVPVPSVLAKGQIHVGDPAVVQHLDAFSAPRLVEYFDEDPCALRAIQERSARNAPSAGMAKLSSDARRENARGVTIEARYTVGEYDILILSARQSAGLAAWLIERGYRIPPGAPRVLNAYVKQGMKFFVAKVNLKEQARLGFATLRPLQIAYESPKFMLPVRLGMANADGPQELFVYAITRRGRVETVNYRNVRLPSDREIPEYVKDEFPGFYRDLFAHQTAKEGMGVVFTEYAWDMSWCDPCASAPLSADELRSLGVWWAGGSAPGPVFVTRLHARYDRASFPEDPVFQLTDDRTNFQGRYVLRHEWAGESRCEAVWAYRRELPRRRAEQAKTLAELTGWNLERIRRRMAVGADWSRPGELVAVRWWDSLWAR